MTLLTPYIELIVLEVISQKDCKDLHYIYTAEKNDFT